MKQLRIVWREQCRMKDSGDGGSCQLEVEDHRLTLNTCLSLMRLHSDDVGPFVT